MSNVSNKTTGNQSIVVSHDPYADAAKLFVNLADEAIAEHGKFTVALSGGSTPTKLYELLASDAWRNRVPWSKTQFFWSDERFVAPTDSSSNFHMTQQAMLGKVPAAAENVHRVMTESRNPDAAAQAYEQQVRYVVPAGPGGLPEFDLILLGLGTNGHTASIFPHEPAVHETERLVVADNIKEVNMTRVTFTAPLINAARHVIFFVVGEEKAPVVHEVIEGKRDPERLPAQLIKPSPGTLTWLLDSGAAGKLERAA